jgi:hypothetical protein
MRVWILQFTFFRMRSFQSFIFARSILPLHAEKRRGAEPLRVGNPFPVLLRNTSRRLVLSLSLCHACKWKW